MDNILSLQEEFDKTNEKAQRLTIDIQELVNKINNKTTKTESEKDMIRTELLSQILISRTLENLGSQQFAALSEAIEAKYYELERRHMELQKALMSADGKHESLLEDNSSRLQSMTVLELESYIEAYKNVTKLLSAIHEDVSKTYLEQMELLRFIKQREQNG